MHLTQILKKVYVYFPVEKLDTKEVKEAQLVKQYQYKGETCYDNIISKVTDDGKYIHGIVIYKRRDGDKNIRVYRSVGEESNEEITSALDTK